MEGLPVAEPLRGSDFRGKAALNDGLGETDLQQSAAVQLAHIGPVLARRLTDFAFEHDAEVFGMFEPGQ